MVYSLWKKDQVKITVRLNTVNLTKVKVQSINDVALTTIASNKLRVESFRLVAVYVCDDANDEIMEIFVSRE